MTAYEPNNEVKNRLYETHGNKIVTHKVNVLV